MGKIFQYCFNKYRDNIFNENILFFETLSSLISLSYILLLPGLVSSLLVVIFILFNLKIIINIFFKCKLDYINRCSLILFLILDSIFVQLPGIILSVGLSSQYKIDLLSFNKTAIYQNIVVKLQIFTSKMRLVIANTLNDQYTSKIYFKW